MKLKKTTQVLLVSCLLFACGDTVEATYKTKKEAKTAQLFEKGWLPQIIPESSYSIVTKNNLDTNRSEGTFSFSPEDLQKFTSKLLKLPPSKSSNQTGYLEKGYLLYEYKESGSRWLFFINSEKSKVEYLMETK